MNFFHENRLLLCCFIYYDFERLNMTENKMNDFKKLNDKKQERI